MLFNGCELDVVELQAEVAVGACRWVEHHEAELVGSRFREFHFVIYRTGVNTRQRTWHLGVWCGEYGVVLVVIERHLEHASITI